jgi:hypothetical protein
MVDSTATVWFPRAGVCAPGELSRTARRELARAVTGAGERR